jgi:aminopeptidase N
MLIRRFMASLVSLLVFSAFTATGQTARPNFTRPTNYDVQHYIIRVRFDRPKKQVFGDTTVRLKPLAGGFTQAELDASDMSFESVTLEGSDTPLKFKVANEKVIVTLDKAYKPENTIGIRFKYTATPKKGVYFVDKRVMNGRELSPAQIWTQGEADEAHHWFPSFDFPSDKASTEQFITAPKDETVIANGVLEEAADNPDGTVTHHFRMAIPHSTYLVSFIVGKYARTADKYKDIPLGFYVYPGREGITRPAFGHTRDMMQVFEELTGVDYPYNKYDQTIVANFQFGGMENITATTMADTEIFFAQFDFARGNVENLVSHELAHSWFGNLVTCRNWAELWLNEGWATFMEAAFIEKAYGRAGYMRKIVSDAEIFMTDDAVNPKRNGLFNQNAGDISTLFDRPATIYNKGGAVLHTLREEIGDEAFWKGANIYLNRHKFGNVESSDLRKAMEEASGKDLGWFFDQWVYHAGHPKLEVRPVWNGRSKTLKLTVVQTQKPDKLIPEAFRLPLDLEIVTPGGTKTDRIDVRKRVEELSFKLDAKPTSITLDKLQKIPVKMVKVEPVVEARAAR